MIAKHPLFFIDDLSELQIERGYWYIATPYSKYKDGLEKAYEAALFADIMLQNLGIRTFGPIRISHPIAMMTGLDPYDYGIWVPLNKPFIDKAHGMVIVTFPGWEDSVGIAEEIKLFAAAGKPMFLLDPRMLGWGGTILDKAKALGIEGVFAEEAATVPDDAWTKLGESVQVYNPKQACGAKKIPYSAVPATVIAELALAMQEGALKYGRHNFRVAGQIQASTYYDATRRHLDDWWEGKDFDADSKINLHEVTKAIASLTVLRDSMIQGTFKDDRPPKAPAGWQSRLNAMTVELNEAFPNPVAPYCEAAE